VPKEGDAITGLLDWDMAGVGHPGVDLSSLRLDAALMFGFEAADPVTTAWQDAAGRSADDLPYWDAVAALNQPGDMAAFAPVMHDQGRTDLTAGLLNERRDTFLRGALAALGFDQ
jgi:aminoglycoside phosphotransferase (APT) family kinase protein